MKGTMSKTTMNIRAAGMTVAGWARLNSFNADSVRHVIGGRISRSKNSVSSKIVAALKKDGYWVEPAKEDKVE
jgi:hypothetical protein